MLRKNYKYNVWPIHDICNKGKKGEDFDDGLVFPIGEDGDNDGLVFPIGRPQR